MDKLLTNFRIFEYKSSLMKLLLDVKDSKAGFLMELLNSFSYVKTETIAPTKASLLSDLKGALQEVELAKKGKIKLQSAQDFLNEL